MGDACPSRSEVGCKQCKNNQGDVEDVLLWLPLQPKAHLNRQCCLLVPQQWPMHPTRKVHNHGRSPWFSASWNLGHITCKGRVNYRKNSGKWKQWNLYNIWFIPMLSLKKASSSFGLNSSGAEHEHLKGNAYNELKQKRIQVFLSLFL